MLVKFEEAESSAKALVGAFAGPAAANTGEGKDSSISDRGGLRGKSQPQHLSTYTTLTVSSDGQGACEACGKRGRRDRGLRESSEVPTGDTAVAMVRPGQCTRKRGRGDFRLLERTSKASEAGNVNGAGGSRVPVKPGVFLSFLRGSCANGSRCRLRHDMKAAQKVANASLLVSARLSPAWASLR